LGSTASPQVIEVRTVETATGPFLVHELGDRDAPKVLLLHDEVASGPTDFAERLASRFHVLAPVLPGFGASERPDWVETVPLLVEHLMSFVDSLPGDGRIAVVGASLGGWVAAEIALRLAHREVDLVLIGAAGLAVPGRPTADHWFVDPEDRRAMLWHDPSAAPDVDLDEYLANEESAARYAWNPRFTDDTLGPRLARFKGRALVVFGAEDRFLSPDHAAAWGARLGGATVVVLEDAGHFVARERPSLTASTVLEWLSAGRAG
jgi:pimeloyl-ACP methyl ester carboxylesterase